MIFKGKLNTDISSNYKSTIISSSLGINDGKKISDSDKFKILKIPNFNNRLLSLMISNFYDNKIRVIKGPQMNFYQPSWVRSQPLISPSPL